MINQNLIDEVAEQLGTLLQKCDSQTPCEIKSVLREILQSSFAKLELVTREEFDVQTKVLARTREKLEKLEALVANYEQQGH